MCVFCRNAYNMVLHKFGDKLYNGVTQALTRQLQMVASKIEATQGVPFLKELKQHWDDHNKSTQMIRDILMVSMSCMEYVIQLFTSMRCIHAFRCARRRRSLQLAGRISCSVHCLSSHGLLMLSSLYWHSKHAMPTSLAWWLSAPLQYMDRTYVTQQHKTPVFQLGLDLWRDHIVHNRHIQERLLAILMDLVQKERTGEIIDRGLVRATTQVSGTCTASAPCVCALA